MKITCIIVAVLVAVAFAQFNLVAHEVHSIIAGNNNITVAECTEKCDDVFNLIDPHDETINDDECDRQCRCQLHHTCPRN